ncbi:MULTISPECIES: PucR family transcriptional regulator [Acutalibacteraceae]|uniref:PucR family transcriptional regulator n=1 Tax=Acutalibacteraceae TaxID=3082771 RepID=UPI0013E8DC9D|nr:MULTISPECIES: PucR family transcriptional regulator [Acutalibacteraceae]
MSIVVSDALKIGALSSCKLIAGKDGLNRKVSYIDTMEVPNIQPWLKKNLLLITTGYSIKDDPEALPRLIVDLQKAGAAGLAIKTRFLGDISGETIRLADEMGVPLIEIPKEIPTVEITMPLMKAIVDEHYHNLEFSERMNRKFLELELNNGSFDNIAKTLANLIALPVFIVSRTYSVLAAAGKGSSIPDSIFEADQSGGRRLSKQISSQIAGNDVLFRLENPEVPALFVRSVSVKKQICGYIIVLCQGPDLDDMQLIALNHASISVALEISKLQKLDEHMRFLQNSLFLDLLAGNVKTKEEAESRARLLRWPLPPVRVAVADIDRFEAVSQNLSEEKIQNLKESLHQLIRDHLLSQNFPCAVIIHSDKFVTLLPKSVAAEKITATFNRIRSLIECRHGLSVTVGISDPCASYAELPFHYGEACDAIAIGRAPGSGGPVQMISNVRFEQAILKSCSTVYFRRYVENTIGKLEQYDRQRGTDLAKTLAVLTENMGARQKTAEKLFIHRNTLANRIGKIEKITGVDLSQNENLYRFGFALKIRRYL